MFLFLKHRGTWKFLAKTFRINTSIFDRCIMRVLEVAEPTFFAHAMKGIDDDHTMRVWLNRDGSSKITLMRDIKPMWLYSRQPYLWETGRNLRSTTAANASGTGTRLKLQSFSLYTLPAVLSTTRGCFWHCDHERQFGIPRPCFGNDGRWIGYRRKWTNVWEAWRGLGADSWQRFCWHGKENKMHGTKIETCDSKSHF